MAKCGDKAAWVNVEEGLGLFVRVDFNVLVGYTFVFERDPYTLDEWAGKKLGRIYRGVLVEYYAYQKALP
jgi:hypothetical protein